MNELGLEGVMHYIDMIGALLIVDVLLSGDNAMVIALACRALPNGQRQRAMMIGTLGAVFLRIVLTLVAGLVLSIPLLKIVGGILLVVIAIKLLLIEEETPDTPTAAASGGLWSAVVTVVTADFIMSLDNVVGLAAVAKGDGWMLALGLLISMPLLMFGSLFVNVLIRRYPLLVPCGAAMLGWIAGDIAMSDALIVDWVTQQSPGLAVVVPMLTAAFVLIESRIIQRSAPALATLRAKLEQSRPEPDQVQEPSEPVVQTPPAELPEQNSAVVTEAVTAAAPPAPADRAEEKPLSRRRFPPWVRYLPGLLAGGVVVAGLVRLGMPLPADLKQFDCAGVDAHLLYHEGVPELRLTLGSAYAGASIRADGYLEWGDYHAVSQALGLPPPTHLRPKDAGTVVINGGGFSHVSCTVSAAPAR